MNVCVDAVTKVSLDILRRVYLSAREKDDSIGGDGDDLLNPEDHLFFVDAFEMPRWNWSAARSSFERYVTSPMCVLVSKQKHLELRAIRHWQGQQIHVRPRFGIDMILYVRHYHETTTSPLRLSPPKTTTGS